MKKYDLTVLIKSDVKDVEKDTFNSKLEESIKLAGGQVGKYSEMGSKQLAYPIKRQKEAAFLNWTLELPANGVVEFNKKLTINKEILRHILVTV